MDAYRGPQEHAIRFSTIGSFKGLESETILLVDIDDLITTASLGLVYVGASRAQSLLEVFIAEQQRGAYNDLAYRFGENASGKS